MKNMIIACIVVLLISIILDGIWLYSTGKSFYYKKLNSTNLSGALSPSPKILPALIFYIVFAIGVGYLVINPAIAGSPSLLAVFIQGAVLGLLAYSTYDLTNQTVFSEWPTIITVVDIIWGSILTGTVSTLAVVVMKYFV